MRGAFRKELNKVRASERSGASPEEIHTPRLWYYHQLLFLEDQGVPRRSLSAQSILDNIPFGDESCAEGSEDISRESSPDLGTARFKRPRSKADDVLEKISRRMDAPQIASPKQQHAAFGEHIAEKLRGMPPGNATICQKLINDAIFLAETNNINISCRIVSDDSSSIMHAYVEAINSD